MRFANPREVFGSLHFRLTVWNTLTVFLVVVSTLIGVREALRLALLKEIDQLLVEDTAEMRLTVQELSNDFQRVEHELERKVDTHAHRGLFVELFDRDGKMRWNSGPVPDTNLDRARALSGRTITIGTFRVVQQNLQPNPAGLRSIRVGSSLEPVLTDVNKLTQTMLIVGAVVLLVSPVGGYWLASRATRPLAKIIDTTARLHPSKLDERLHLRGTRDELDRLSQTVNGLLDRIAAFIDQNRQFTANAAHELRSPLAAIQNTLEVALATDRTAEEYREQIGETLEECGVLRDLVNQLLLLSESDAGRMDIDPNGIRLDEVARRSREMFAGVAEAADLKLELTVEPVQVYGDANRLRQVVNNLVDNAIKFSRPGGTISLLVRSDPYTKLAVLQVRDTGRGIAPEDLPHVFERFYRGDKSRQRNDPTAGTGLGLSICQSIVVAHGGSIRVESTPGVSTTFTVLLPSAETLRPDEIGLPLKGIEASTAA